MRWIPRTIKFFYYITILSAFCANMMVVSHTTALSVLGAGMALRGPDGSMMTATDGLYEERESVFKVFGVGLACTVGSVVICVWVLLNPEAALVCMMITMATCHTIWKNYVRVRNRFSYDESQTVDFRDIMEGPANFQAVPSTFRYTSHNRTGNKLDRAAKKSASMPLDHDDDSNGYSNEDTEMQRLRQGNNDSVQRRRGVHRWSSSDPLQTV
jgi:hypothetical protein